MRIRSRLAAVFSTLFIVAALVAVTGVSFGSSASQSDALPGAALESSAVDVAPADECAAPVETPDTSAYECPHGQPYCFQDSQCEDYCGSPEFSVCFQGCCVCSG